MTQDFGPKHLGRLISEALDPHQRAAMTSALNTVLSSFDKPVHVLLLGWKSATLLDVLGDRASKVTIIEGDEALHSALSIALDAKGHGPKVRLLHRDLLDATLEDRADVAVATLNETWFIGGKDVELINRVHAHYLKPDGVMIPRRAVHLFELSAASNAIGGISLRYPRYTRPGEPVPVLSEAKHFVTHAFDQAPLPTQIDDTIYVKPLLGGTVTGLKLRTIYELASNVIQTTSASGVQSILVPMREDIDAEDDQPLSVLIRYNTKEGLDGLRLSAKALPKQTSKALDPGQHAAQKAFEQRIDGFIDTLDARGRGSDLDRVVSYTIEPHGDVGRLTALFWTIDEEFHQPLSKVIEAFRHEAGATGPIPDDETIYRLMLNAYNSKRGHSDQ